MIIFVRICLQFSLSVYSVYNVWLWGKHMDSKKLIKLLFQDGWIHVATRGSHWQFKHPKKKGKVTVPHPKRDMPMGTVKSVLKQAELKKK